MKKLQKLFAMLLAVCMMMSLLSVSAFAEESTSSLVCGEEEHVHSEACWCRTEKDLNCEKKEHSHEQCESNCETQYDLICNDPHHTDACFVFVPHEHTDDCDTDCTQGSEELNCSEQHAHGEVGGDCYKAHVCVDSCYACGLEAYAHSDSCYVVHVCDVECYICGKAAHTHDRTCLSDEAKAELDAAEAELDKFPSLQEMKDKRTAYDTGNSKETAAVDQVAYMAYLDSAFAAREQYLAGAQAAYNALPSELKAMISEADKAKLETELPDRWNDNLSKRITAGEGAYTWQYTGNRYEYSLHLNNAYNWSDGAWGTGMFMLVDTDMYDGKTWRPDGPYQTNGDSNYVLAYCCDAAMGIVKDSYYKRINPEDSTYFNDGAAEKIRAIVLSSYPFVTMEEMKAELKAEIDDSVLSDAEIDAMTENEIIAAVQYAVWYHANSNDFKYYGPTDYGSSYTMVTENVYHDLTNSTWRWWDDDAASTYMAGRVYAKNVKNYNYYEDVDKSITAVKEYLTSLEGITLDTTKDQVVINSVEITGSEPVLNGENGTYSVALKVQLNSGGSSRQDTLKIYATSPVTGDMSEIPVVYGQKEYTLALTAKQGEEIVVKVEGTQVLPKGVYFYEPEGKNGEAVRDVSQNLVGIAMGETKIAATKKYTVNIPEQETPEVTASLTLYKVSSLAGKSLSGAEFTLAYIQQNGTSVEIDTYPVDNTGKLEISGLKSGMTYTLKETNAPAGYVAMDGVIKFTASEGGKLQFDVVNLPDDVRCETANDEYILTVVNCPEPISVKKVWVDNENEAGVRPETITVQLMKDDVQEGEDIVLSAENRWMHTWEGLDPDYTWTVAEKNVPEGYSAAVTQEGTEFTITNTYSSDPPSDDPPSNDPPSNDPPSNDPPSNDPPSNDPPSNDPPSNDPPEDPPLFDVPDEDPPLSNIPDEDPPLAMLPDEEVPLALLPATGDASAIWMALSALSGAGLFVTRKKRDEE